jgi:hypothetical protein
MKWMILSLTVVLLIGAILSGCKSKEENITRQELPDFALAKANKVERVYQYDHIKELDELIKRIYSPINEETTEEYVQRAQNSGLVSADIANYLGRIVDIRGNIDMEESWENPASGEISVDYTEEVSDEIITELTPAMEEAVENTTNNIVEEIEGIGPYYIIKGDFDILVGITRSWEVYKEHMMNTMGVDVGEQPLAEGDESEDYIGDEPGYSTHIMYIEEIEGATPGVEVKIEPISLVAYTVYENTIIMKYVYNFTMFADPLFVTAKLGEDGRVETIYGLE